MSTAVETEGRKVVSEDFLNVQVGANYTQRVAENEYGVFQTGLYTVEGTLKASDLAFTGNASIPLVQGIPGCVLIPEHVYFNYIELGLDYTGSDSVDFMFSDGTLARSQPTLTSGFFTAKGNKIMTFNAQDMHGVGNPPPNWLSAAGNVAPYAPAIGTGFVLNSEGGGGFHGGNSIVKYLIQFNAIPVS